MGEPCRQLSHQGKQRGKSLNEAEGRVRDVGEQESRQMLASRKKHSMSRPRGNKS